MKVVIGKVGQLFSICTKRNVLKLYKIWARHKEGLPQLKLNFYNKRFQVSKVEKFLVLKILKIVRYYSHLNVEEG